MLEDEAAVPEEGAGVLKDGSSKLWDGANAAPNRMAVSSGLVVETGRVALSVALHLP